MSDVWQVMIRRKPKDPEEPVTYTLPAGDYVIGDVLTAAATSLETPWSPAYNQGQHQCEGLPYVIGSTTHGDGIFKGSNGEHYGTDTGQLGIMDARLVRAPDIILFGSRHQFASDVSIQIWSGVFKISSADMQFEIDTGSFA